MNYSTARHLVHSSSPAWKIGGAILGGFTLGVIATVQVDKSKPISELKQEIYDRGYVVTEIVPIRHPKCVMDSIEMDLVALLSTLGPESQLRAIAEHPDWRQHNPVWKIEMDARARLVASGNLSYQLPSTDEILSELDSKKK